MSFNIAKSFIEHLISSDEDVRFYNFLEALKLGCFGLNNYFVVYYYDLFEYRQQFRDYANRYNHIESIDIKNNLRPLDLFNENFQTYEHELDKKYNEEHVLGPGALCYLKYFNIFIYNFSINFVMSSDFSPYDVDHAFSIAVKNLLVIRDDYKKLKKLNRRFFFFKKYQPDYVTKVCLLVIHQFLYIHTRLKKGKKEIDSYDYFKPIFYMEKSLREKLNEKFILAAYKPTLYEHKAILYWKEKNKKNTQDLSANKDEPKTKVYAKVDTDDEVVMKTRWDIVDSFYAIIDSLLEEGIKNKDEIHDAIKDLVREILLDEEPWDEDYEKVLTKNRIKKPLTEDLKKLKEYIDPEVAIEVSQMTIEIYGIVENTVKALLRIKNKKTEKDDIL